MRTSEWVIAGYFLYLLATGAVLRVSLQAILRVAALALLTCGLIVLLARTSSPIVSILRDWLPGAYVMIGYWATGLLYRGANRELERTLDAFDSRLFTLLRALGVSLPRAAREVLEFAYLVCYPLVPAGVAVLYAAGERSRTDAYWTLVLVATFAAYGVLPWAGTRPPRALEAGDGVRRSEGPKVRWSEGSKVRRSEGPNVRRSVAGGDSYVFQRVNLAVLERGSIQVNTFPSGHAASAWGVALFMTKVDGPAWLVFALFAGAIGAGAVAGRYHYALDVLAGALVAGTVFLLLP